METQAKKSMDIYSILMLMSATFLLIGSILLAIELNRYGGFFNGYPWWKTPVSSGS